MKAELRPSRDNKIKTKDKNFKLIIWVTDKTF